MPSFLRRLPSFAVVSIVSVVAGCSSGSSGGAGTAGSRDEFIAQFCAEFMPCCTAAGLSSDPAQCTGLYGALLPVDYNAAAGDQCLAEMRAASKAGTFCKSGGGSSAACKSVFPTSGGGGTKAPGETCDQDSDCKSSPEGKVDCASLYKDGATIKKCQIQIAGKAGDSPCVGTVDGSLTTYSSSGTATDIPLKGYLCDVKDSVYCDSTSGACTAIAKVGGACSSSSSYSCVKEALCDYKTKTCVARKAVGETCDSMSNDCVPTAYCDGTSKKCVAKSADGSPCTSYKTCLSNSCVNSKCAASGSGDLSLAFICKK